MSSRAKDITGNRYGKLTALQRTAKSKNGDYLWFCTCDCGNTFETTIGRLNFGSATSCGCLRKESPNKTHGMSKSSEYNSWCHMKERVQNLECPDYLDYGGAGVTLQESWNDFQTFFEYIGPKPKDGKHYTVNRLDNSEGYKEGNVEWADDSTQARNKTYQRNNTSGVTGVVWDTKVWPSGNGETLYAKAIWNKLDGKQARKCFSTKTYGLLPAFAMACAHREKMIQQLNEQGAGYSDKHGK